MLNVTWSYSEPFTRLSSLWSVPNQAGIYCILLKKGYASYELCYVGQAKDLKKRLSEHQSPLEPNTGLRKYLSEKELKIAWITRYTQEDRDAIELYLYKTYKPVLNEQTPPGNKMLAVNVCW